MSGPSLLEQKLGVLLERFKKVLAENRGLAETIAKRDRRIREIETRCDQFRAQIDALGKDRFTLKQLQDERKIIRKKLESAVNRLQALEEEVEP